MRGPDSPEALNRRLLAEHLLGGLPLGRFYPALADCALYCCTEMNTRADIEKLICVLSEQS